MAILGHGEEYSREAFDRVKRNVDVTYNPFSRSSIYTSPAFAEIAEIIRQDIKKAREMLVKQLHERGEQEAHEMNVQYGRLCENVDDALRAKFEFERDKLDMHKDEGKEKRAAS